MESIYQKLKTNMTFYFIKNQKKRLNEQLKKPKESLKKTLLKTVNQIQEPFMFIDH